jgi:hypothetical protein
VVTQKAVDSPGYKKGCHSNPIRLYWYAVDMRLHAAAVVSTVLFLCSSYKVFNMDHDHCSTSV